MNIHPEILKKLKEDYPPGTKIKLIKMDDPYTKIRPGEEGTVIAVDDIGTIHVNWDSGSSLGIVYGEDACKKIK